MNFPAPSALIAHRDEALLLETIDDVGPDGLTASLVVRGHSSFSRDDGALPAWTGPEIMAQAVSAFATFRRGLPFQPKPGLLLGVRRYHCRRPSGFRLGMRLTVSVRESTRDDSGSAVFDSLLAVDGTEVAEAMLTVFEPADVIEALAEQIA